MKSASSLVALRIGACVHIAGVDRDDQLIVLHVLVTVIRQQLKLIISCPGDGFRGS